MDPNADLNNVPIRDKNAATTREFEDGRASKPTTLLTRTKPLEPRQDTQTAAFTSSITPAPGVSSGLTSSSSSSSSTNPVSSPAASAANTTARPIVIFPHCPTCAAGPSALPAAITGSCATAHWTLIRLSTAYIWAPVIGCSGDQPECCVYGADPVSTVTETTTDTVGQLATITRAQHEQSEEYPFPTASGETGGSNAKETLAACPADHETVTGDGWRGCCPFGFTQTSALGAQTPCATAYSYSLEIPDVPVSSLPTKGHIPVVQTISDSVYAVQYSLPPPPESTQKAGSDMPIGKKAGIAVGSGIAGVVFGMLIGWAIVSNRRRDREIEARKRKKKETSDTGEGKGKGKEVDYSEVLGQQQQQQQQWPPQQQIQPQPQQPQQSPQEMQIYPIYPRAQITYTQSPPPDETSPVSPTSPTSPTTSSLTWGTSTQPSLGGSCNSYGQQSSSSQGAHSASLMGGGGGGYAAAGMSQIAEYYSGSWGRQR